MILARAGVVAAASSLALAGCLGDDTTIEIEPRAVRDASVQDATIGPGAPDARARKDAAELTPEIDAGAPCVPSFRDAATDASAEGGFDAADDAAADAADDAGGDAGVCAPRTLALVDFGRAPRISTGGARPGAWQIGKASQLFGPREDRAGVAGECFLATRPGARYRLSEESWAELEPIDLRGVASCTVTLSMWIWFELEFGLDAANVVVSAEGGPYEQVGAADGPSLYNMDDFLTSDCGGGDCQVFLQSVWSTFAPGSMSWREARFDLSRFAGKRDVRIRFQFHSDGFENYQGIYVQDVAVRVP